MFHSEYSNADFVCQILPKIDEDGSITYDFIPGPFTLAIEDAYACPKEKVASIIEEINRGDPAAIFGEVFQLLDRMGCSEDPEHKQGSSEYEITAAPVMLFLEGADSRRKEGRPVIDPQILNLRDGKLYIPANLSVITTMNTSDQGVHVLDTAFTRRWDFERYDGKDGNDKPKGLVPKIKVPWLDFIDIVNGIITAPNNNIPNCEDKQLGPYFVKDDALCSSGSEECNDKIDKFAFKVLGYLWDTVSRSQRKILFTEKCHTFLKVVDEFRNKGLDAFSSDLKEKLGRKAEDAGDHDDQSQRPVQHRSGLQR